MTTDEALSTDAHDPDTAARGRVERLLERSPFWFEVAHGVTSALITSFVVAWVGSAIVLAALGEAGSDIRWELAVSWSFLFLLLGAALACLGVIGFAAADFPGDPTRRRGMIVVAVALSWILALAGSQFVPESSVDGAVSVLVLTLVLGVASSAIVLGRGRPTGTDRAEDWTDTFWRVVQLAVGLTTALMATSLNGLALAVIFQRATG